MRRILLVGLVLWSAFSLGSAGHSQAGDDGGYRPHYQGFGIRTKGGRGGRVLRVTNLHDNGPGSLRAALETKEPRFVIFDLSGTIPLQSPLYIRHPFVTIAGQTAPSPGINIRTHGLWIGTHDVVVQHLRFRYGYSGPMPGADPVVRMHDGAHDMILDHVSIAWAMYMASIAVAFPAKEMHLGLTSRNGHPTRVALLDCLFSHPLARGFTGQFDYSGWGIMLGHLGGTVAGHQYTLARNLFVHNSFRQPLIQSGRNQVINNLVYGTGPWTPQDNQWAYLMLWQQSDPAMDKNPAFSTQAVIVNTVTLDSDGTGLGDTAWPSIVGSTPGLKTFHFAFNKEQLACQKTSGNQGPHITGPDLAGQKAGIYGYLEDGSNTDLWYRSAPDWHTRRRFQTLAADAVPAYVTANAGARPLDRDSVDLAAVSQTRAALRDDLPHMGSRIRSQDDMGGYPVLTVNTRRLRLPAKPDAIAPGQRFRTNLEIWLERLARDLDPPMMGPTRGSYPISCQQQQPHLLSRSRQKSRPP